MWIAAEMICGRIEFQTLWTVARVIPREHKSPMKTNYYNDFLGGVSHHTLFKGMRLRDTKLG